MTKEHMNKEAMKLALEALETITIDVKSTPTAYEAQRQAITALKALAEQEPVAWLFQHEETGRTTCVDAQQVEWGFAENNPRWQKIAPLYTTPQAQRKTLTEEEIWAAIRPLMKSDEVCAAIIEVSMDEYRAIETARINKIKEQHMKEEPTHTFKQPSERLITLMDFKPNHNIAFHRDGTQIGVLDFNGPEMTFSGDADESAKVFFDFLAVQFKERLDQERADEREACAKVCEATDDGTPYNLTEQCAAAIRNRSKT